MSQRELSLLDTGDHSLAFQTRSLGRGEALVWFPLGSPFMSHFIHSHCKYFPFASLFYCNIMVKATIFPLQKLFWEQAQKRVETIVLLNLCWGRECIFFTLIVFMCGGPMSWRSHSAKQPFWLSQSRWLHSPQVNAITLAQRRKKLLSYSFKSVMKMIAGAIKRKIWSCIRAEQREKPMLDLISRNQQSHFVSNLSLLLNPLWKEPRAFKSSLGQASQRSPQFHFTLNGISRWTNLTKWL